MDAGKAQGKMGSFKVLAHKYDIVLLQELHGHEGDLATLQKELPTHHVFASFGCRADVGGVLIVVRDSFMMHFRAAKATVHVQGRCMSVQFIGEGFKLLVTNIRPWWWM